MQAPQSTSLLRALLREASYLPDANARSFFRRYIVNRFQAYQPADKASLAADTHRHGFGKRKHSAIIDERARVVQRRARRGLNYLRRANNGDHNCLKRVLFFAYGRVGKRKHALLADLLRPDDPTAAPELSPLQELYYSRSRFLSFFDAPKKASQTDYDIPISDRYRRLKTTLKAQVQHDVALGRGIKRPQINTPINNIWGRPMPIRRARNIARKWYAETMTRLLPPLPTDEFDDMQAMADGRKEVSLVKRRSPAIELRPRPAKELPAADQFARLVQDALVLEKPSKADTCIRPRQIDARIMRRLYVGVLSYSSKLEWNERHKKWESVWGRMRGMNPNFNSGAQHDGFFAGVDDRGFLPKKQSTRCQASPDDEHDIDASLSIDLAVDQNARSKREKYTNVPFYFDLLSQEHPTRVSASKYLEKKGRVQSPSGAARLSVPLANRTTNRS